MSHVTDENGHRPLTLIHNIRLHPIALFDDRLKLHLRKYGTPKGTTMPQSSN
jgi:hypothetical protein